MTPEERRKLGQFLQWDLIRKDEASFEAGPLLWLTQYTKTEDEHWLNKGTEPVSPFPKLDYFKYLVEDLLTESTLLIPKSREMMTSWLVCGYITWMCRTKPHIFWLLQTEKEDKVTQLVNYCRILCRYESDWLKKRSPIIVDKTTELKWQNGSRVLGVPKGENQVRMFHPYGYMMDEAAFLPEAEQCFNAVRPVAKQIVAVSSDGIGWFHNEAKLIA